MSVSGFWGPGNEARAPAHFTLLGPDITSRLARTYLLKMLTLYIAISVNRQLFPLLPCMHVVGSSQRGPGGERARGGD